MSESFLNGRVTLHAGDSREVLKTLADNSIDSIVTDPPYALVSMTKARPDLTGKGNPYARKQAVSGFMGKQWDTGETAFAVEFWQQCLRVLKPGGHCVAFSGTRTYHRMACAIEDAGFEIRDQIGWAFGQGFPKSHNAGNGWGTALKPAWEPIVLARKALERGLTVAANVLAHGVGAINIDGCRVGTDESTIRQCGPDSAHAQQFGGTQGGIRGQDGLGRWPANLLHDGSDEVLAGFPDADGGRPITNAKANPTDTFSVGYTRSLEGTGRGDSGSAARFFYTAKADADDRLGSKHPTVKPVDLMQWLCRLVTPPCVTTLECVHCLNENLQRVPEKVQAKTDGAVSLLDCLSGEGRGQGAEISVKSVPELRGENRTGREEVLLGAMPGGFLQDQADPMSALPYSVHAAGGSEVLLGGVRPRFTSEVADSVCDLSGGLSAGKAGPNLLQQEVRCEDAHANPDNNQVGLCGAMDAGTPYGTEVGLLDGASPSNGAAPQSEFGLDRSRPSHQRQKDRQPRRKSASDGSDPTQSISEGNAETDRVSALQSNDNACKCPTCGNALVKVTRRGTVLDMFAGTGTTGEAAYREGFNAVLIERELEYQQDIRRRMGLVLSGPDERARESIKARLKDTPVDHGPLFGGLQAIPPRKIPVPI